MDDINFFRVLILMVCLFIHPLYCLVTLDINIKPDEVEESYGFVTFSHLRKRSIDEASKLDTFDLDTIDLDLYASPSKIRLNLQKNQYITANIPTYVSKDGVISEFKTRFDETVFYQDPKQGAVFVLHKDGNKSHSLYGVVQSNSYTYTVQNIVNATRGRLKPGWNTFSIVKKDTPQINFADSSMKKEKQIKLHMKKSENSRQKRASGAYAIEMLIVVDYSAYANWYSRSTSSSASDKETEAINNIKQFYAFIITGMDGMYKNLQTSAYTISIVFAGIIVCQTTSDAAFAELLPKDTSTTPNSIDSDDLLDKFAEFINNNVTIQHDHAMLFSRYNFVSGQIDNAGLAYQGTMCGSLSQSVVEEDDNYITITVASHELGHGLSAQHDGTGNSCSFSDHYIMASSSSPQTNPTTASNPWKFSQCSTDYFTTYIDSLSADNCMTSFGTSYDPNALSPYDQILPGQLYSADQQCKNIYGDVSRMCKGQYDGDFTSICNVLYCDDGSGSCYTNIAGDGTHCGNKKWCVSGICTYDINAPPGNENCLYGDDVGRVYSNIDKNCSQLIAVSESYCNEDYVSSKCCQSCPQPTQITETTTIGQTDPNTSPKIQGSTIAYTGSTVDIIEPSPGLSTTGVISTRNIDDIGSTTISPVADVDSQCRRNQESPDSRLCRSLFDADFSTICGMMYCLKPNTSLCNSFQADDKTLCGNRKWCINGVCTSDPEAPEADEACLHGDQPGKVFTSGASCADMRDNFPSVCDDNQAVRLTYCCASCKSLTTTTSSIAFTTTQDIEETTKSVSTYATTQLSTSDVTTEPTTTAETTTPTTIVVTTEPTTTVVTTEPTTTDVNTEPTTTVVTTEPTTTDVTTEPSTAVVTTEPTTTVVTTVPTTTVVTTEPTTTVATTEPSTTAVTTEPTTTVVTTEPTTTVATTEPSTTVVTTELTTTVVTTEPSTTFVITEPTTTVVTTEPTTTVVTTEPSTTFVTTELASTVVTTEPTTTVVTTEPTTTVITTEPTTTEVTTERTTTVITTEPTTTEVTTEPTTTVVTTEPTTTVITTEATTTEVTTERTTTVITTEPTTTEVTTEPTTTVVTTEPTTAVITTEATTAEATTEATTTVITTEPTTAVITTEATTTEATTEATTTVITTEPTTTEATTEPTTTVVTTEPSTTFVTTELASTVVTTEPTTAVVTTEPTTTVITPEPTTTEVTTERTITVITTEPTTTEATTEATTTVVTTEPCIAVLTTEPTTTVVTTEPSTTFVTTELASTVVTTEPTTTVVTTEPTTTVITTEPTTTEVTTERTTTVITTEPTTTEVTTEPTTTVVTTEPTTAVITTEATTAEATTEATTTVITTEPTTAVITTEATTTEATTEATTTVITTEPTTTEATTEPTTTVVTTEPSTTFVTTELASTVVTTEPTTAVVTTEPTTTVITTEPTTTEVTTERTITVITTEPTTTEATTEATTTVVTTEPCIAVLTTEPTTTVVTTEPSTTFVTTELASTVVTTEPTTTVVTTEPTTTVITTEPTTTEVTTERTTTVITTEPTTTEVTTEPTTTVVTTEPTTAVITTEATTTEVTTERTTTVITTEPTTTEVTTEPTTTVVTTEPTTAVITTKATTAEATTEATTTVITTEPTTTDVTNEPTTTVVTTEPTTNVVISETTTTDVTTKPTTTVVTNESTITTVVTTEPTTTVVKTEPTETTTLPTTTEATTISTATEATNGPTTTEAKTEPTTTDATTEPTTSTSVSLTFDFIYFGFAFGDNLLMGDDKTSLRIYVYTGLPTDGYVFHYITISTNGLLCLDNRFRAFDPIPLNALSNRDIIAAFWTDLVIVGKSRLWYHTYSQMDYINNYSSRSRLVLAEVSDRVKIFTGKTGFEARWVLVATWYRVRLTNSNEEVTFQIVLTTDGSCTYSFVNYKDFDVVNPLSNQNVVIGYKIKDDFLSSNYSFTKDAFRMARNRGNTLNGDQGIYFMSLTATTCKTTNVLSQKCLSWFTRQQATRRIILLAQKLQRHICTYNKRTLLRFRPLFIRIRRLELDNRMMCYANYQFGISRVCCYHKRFGTIINGYPFVTGLSTANPFLQPQEFLRDTMEPRVYCVYSQLSYLYRYLRPAGISSRRRRRRRAFVWGDPHITTLDNFRYIYNGLGEFILGRIFDANVTFELQCRTGRPNVDDAPRNATVFTAFVAKDHTNSTFQVELSNSHNSMIISSNGDDYTDQFYNTSDDFQEMLPSLILRRVTNLTLSILFTEPDIELQISVGNRQLIFSITVPDDYHGMVSGLLGNFDGDPNNDLILPNRTSIPTNITERDLYESFGNLWAVTPETSLFTYSNGKSTHDYRDPEFTPVFLDEIDLSTMQREITACGGNSSLNKPCLYDYIATGDEQFALATLQTDLSNQEDVITLGYEAPIINGNTTVQAEVDMPVTLSYNVTSQTDNVEFVLISEPNSGLNKSRDGELFVLTWIPESLVPEQIIVTVVDEHNLTAEPIEVHVVLCSGCTNQGTCDYNTIRNQTYEYFKIAACNCNIGFTGDDCEESVNECDDYPCGNHRYCTGLSPSLTITEGQGYRCGGCNNGYVLVNKTCQDNTTGVQITTQRTEDTLSKDIFFLILGLSIGLPILLTVVVLSICLLIKKPKKVTPLSSEADLSDRPQGSMFANDSIFLFNSLDRKDPSRQYLSNTPWPKGYPKRPERDISWT